MREEQPPVQEPLSFEKIEEIFHQHAHRIANTPQLGGQRIDAMLELFAGTIQEILTSLKAHHPGQPLILPKGGKH